MNELNIEAFGGIIDQLLTENEVNMLITLPKGSLDVQIQENIKLGNIKEVKDERESDLCAE